jgi:hypothetical protein
MDWQAILSALLKWTWKQAFAIAAGGFTTLYGVRHGYIEGTTEFTIAYLTFAASWYLVALIVERITKFVVELVTSALRSRKAQKTAVAKKAVEDRQVIDNLKLLTSTELDALIWIYHRYAERVRANIQFDTVFDLMRYGILVSEDPNTASYDRVLFINPAVRAVLKSRFGPRNLNFGSMRPPWLTGRQTWNKCVRAGYHHLGQSRTLVLPLSCATTTGSNSPTSISRRSRDANDERDLGSNRNRCLLVDLRSLSNTTFIGKTRSRTSNGDAEGRD